MTSIPAEALCLLQPLAPAFTAPTFRRVTLLALAAILTTGRRTVQNLLRTTRGLAPGDASGYHRVLSFAKFNGLRRNVAIAMGNSGDRQFIPALEKMAAGGDAAVVEHAQWALQKLGNS